MSNSKNCTASDIQALMSEVGLGGPFQVHYGPQFLAYDVRAHQVVVPPHDNTAVRTHFRSMQGSVWSGGKEWQWDGFPSDEVLIIPAQDSIHPGGFYGLVAVVDRLVGPGGCPWDIEQTHQTLTKYLIEESYELIEAIENQDEEGMQEELGDVLLQPLMHSQKKKLSAGWDIEEVCERITAKLIRRHPHVFGDAVASNSDQVLQQWDSIKRQERSGEVRKGILSGVPASMPSLSRAHEISKRAARSGFEWECIEDVWKKFDEELDEFRAALASGDKSEVSAELGDLIFTIVNIARWIKIDSEEALRHMLLRFEKRFTQMEQSASKPLAELTAAEWDELWNQAKQSHEGSA